jgi:hypothetical protein
MQTKKGSNFENKRTPVEYVILPTLEENYFKSLCTSFNRQTSYQKSKSAKSLKVSKSVLKFLSFQQTRNSALYKKKQSSQTLSACQTLSTTPYNMRPYSHSHFKTSQGSHIGVQGSVKFWPSVTRYRTKCTKTRGCLTSLRGQTDEHRDDVGLSICYTGSVANINE